MARVKFIPEIDTMNGRMGDAVFYGYHDRHYARIHIIPRNPDTASQVFVRRTFGDAVRAWQALDQESRRKFIRKGRMRSINGYNLFISEYMKERMPSIRSCSSGSVFKNRIKTEIPLMLQCASVPSTLFNRRSYNSPPRAAVRDKIPA